MHIPHLLHHATCTLLLLKIFQLENFPSWFGCKSFHWSPTELEVKEKDMLELVTILNPQPKKSQLARQWWDVSSKSVGRITEDVFLSSRFGSSQDWWYLQKQCRIRTVTVLAPISEWITACCGTQVSIRNSQLGLVQFGKFLPRQIRAKFLAFAGGVNRVEFPDGTSLRGVDELNN